jgi:hypothetical protein
LRVPGPGSDCLPHQGRRPGPSSTPSSASSPSMLDASSPTFKELWEATARLVGPFVEWSPSEGQREVQYVVLELGHPGVIVKRGRRHFPYYRSTTTTSSSPLARCTTRETSGRLSPAGAACPRIELRSLRPHGRAERRHHGRGTFARCPCQPTDGCRGSGRAALGRRIECVRRSWVTRVSGRPQGAGPASLARLIRGHYVPSSDGLGGQGGSPDLA